MKLGSAFTGVGCFDLAAQAVGMELAWQIEIDADCNAVLEHRFPGVPKYSDIRDCHSKEYLDKHNKAKRKEVQQELAQVDVICGGFP